MRSEDEGEVDQQEAEEDVVAAEEVGEAVEVAVKVVVEVVAEMLAEMVA